MHSRIDASEMLVDRVELLHRKWNVMNLECSIMTTEQRLSLEAST